MSISTIAKTLEKLAVDNSPTILTALGVVGTLGTAVLTGKATFKAADILFDEELRFQESVLPNPTPLDRKDKIKLVWKLYIPPAVMGTVTVGSIIMANRIGSKRAAAIAAAYTILEKASDEYRSKVIETIGENKEQKIRTEIVEDRLRRNPITEGNVMVVNGGDHMFCEMYTGRYFRSDTETVRRAVNDINHQINTHHYASLQDFYDILGIPQTAVSNEMGWNVDKMMDVAFTAILNSEGQPCVAIDYTVTPIRDHSRFSRGV